MLALFLASWVSNSRTVLCQVFGFHRNSAPDGQLLFCLYKRRLPCPAEEFQGLALEASSGINLKPSGINLNPL